MNMRINEGYIITDSVHIGRTEFVLGVHGTAPSQFVTWACKGGNDYYWGHYHSDLLSATKDLLERAAQELEYCMAGREQPSKNLKEPEEPCL